MGTFEATAAHRAIFDAVKAKEQNIIIEAVAGAGKTTTIVEALRCVPSRERCVFIAFNASIAKELGRRCPPHVEARTMNSLGHRAWARHVERETGSRQLKVDADKMRQILWDLADQGKISDAEKLSFGGPAVRLARLGKSCGIIVDGADDGLVPDTVQEWANLIAHFDVDIPERPEDAEGRVIDLARTLLRLSTTMHAIIDFDDQIYLPFVFDADAFRFDRVFVDEAQDLSPLQHDLLRRSLRSDGQLVAVGDPAQAVYGFRGADSNSITNLAQAFDAEMLPLHVSYRCPRAVVALAQQIVPHILAHPDAPEGLVDTIPKHVEKVTFSGGDLIVCRTTAPVVSLAFALIRKGVSAEVLGRDIGKGLITLIERFKAPSIDGMLEGLESWERKEVAKATAKGQDAKVLQVEDKADTIRVLAEGQTSVRAIIDTINDLFSGEPSKLRVTLATVHKAKGLEADRVYVLNAHRMPHPMAKKAWQQVQEKNLMYVAYTRAKKELRFLVGPEGKTSTR